MVTVGSGQPGRGRPRVEGRAELLELAGMTTVSGDLDPLSTGVVHCELVCAL
jgi:hypothetical protein